MLALWGFFFLLLVVASVEGITFNANWYLNNSSREFVYHRNRSDVEDRFFEMKRDIVQQLREINVVKYVMKHVSSFGSAEATRLQSIENSIISAIDLLNPYYTFNDSHALKEKLFGLEGWLKMRKKRSIDDNEDHANAIREYTLSQISHNLKITGNSTSSSDDIMTFLLPMETLTALVSSSFQRYFESIKFHVLFHFADKLISVTMDQIQTLTDISQAHYDVIKSMLMGIIRSVDVRPGITVDSLDFGKFIRCRDFVDSLARSLFKFMQKKQIKVFPDNLPVSGSNASNEEALYSLIIQPFREAIFAKIEGYFPGQVDPLERLITCLEIYMIGFDFSQYSLIRVNAQEVNQMMMAKKIIPISMTAKQHFIDSFPADFAKIISSPNLFFSVDYLKFQVSCLLPEYITFYDQQLLGDKQLNDMKGSDIGILLPIMVRDWHAFQSIQWFNYKANLMIEQLFKLIWSNTLDPKLELETMEIDDLAYLLGRTWKQILLGPRTRNSKNNKSIISLENIKEAGRKIIKRRALLQFKKRINQEGMEFWDIFDSVCTSCILDLFQIKKKR